MLSLRMLSKLSRLFRCQQRPIQTIFFIPLLNNRGLEVRSDVCRRDPFAATMQGECPWRGVRPSQPLALPSQQKKRSFTPFTLMLSFSYGTGTGSCACLVICCLQPAACYFSDCLHSCSTLGARVAMLALPLSKLLPCQLSSKLREIKSGVTAYQPIIVRVVALL